MIERMRSAGRRRRLLAGGLAVLAAGAGGAIALATGSSAAAPAAAARPAASAAAALKAGPATAAFGVALLRRLGGGGNVVFSPDSIDTVLGMAGVGARGKTATQLAHALELGAPSTLASLGRLQAAIAAEQRAAAGGDAQAPTFDIANALFLQQGFALQPAFTSSLQSNFGAAPQLVDFAGNPSAAVAAINGYVATHTQGLIPKILGSLPTSTVLALVNAIYLKAAWANPFTPAGTGPAAFHAPAGPVTVPFMNETDPLAYGAGHGYAAVDLPYRSSTLSMLIVLPSGGMAAFTRGLTPARYAGIVRGLRRQEVNLSVPRFHLSFHQMLNATLQGLGITNAFSDGADFSGIPAKPTPLKIGVVEHAADFTIDEHGTVATAATVGTIVATAEPVPPRAVRFNANRPFLFFLRDDRSGAVLFAGRLSSPASAGAPASGS